MYLKVRFSTMQSMFSYGECLYAQQTARGRRAVSGIVRLFPAISCGLSSLERCRLRCLCGPFERLVKLLWAVLESLRLFAALPVDTKPSSPSAGMNSFSRH